MVTEETTKTREICGWCVRSGDRTQIAHGSHTPPCAARGGGEKGGLCAIKIAHKVDRTHFDRTQKNALLSVCCEKKSCLCAMCAINFLLSVCVRYLGGIASNIRHKGGIGCVEGISRFLIAHIAHSPCGTTPTRYLVRMTARHSMTGATP
jgi:hypothetical protein